MSDDTWLNASTWAEFRDSTPPEPDYYVQELVIKGGLGLIGAAAKAGKTWLAEYLAVCLATGKPFLQWETGDPVRVLYLALEGAASGHKKRFSVLARGLGLDPDSDRPMSANLNIVTQPPAGLNLVDPEHALLFVASIEHANYHVVFIDVARSAAKIRESGEGTYDLRALQAALRPLTSTGVTIIFVHHAKKTTPDNGHYVPALERLSGSGDWGGVVDFGLILERSADGWRDAALHIEGRDIPTPPGKHRVTYEGEGSGPNGGILSTDTITCALAEDEEDSSLHTTQAIAVAVWLLTQPSKSATKQTTADHFALTSRTLSRLHPYLTRQGITITPGVGRGKPTIYARSA